MEENSPPAGDNVGIKVGDSSPATASADVPETVWSKLNAWGRSLEDWQKFILTQAVRNTTLNEGQIDDAYRLFLRYANLDKVDDSLPEIPESVTGREDAAHTGSFVLQEIHSLKNVNAIPDGSRLTFGPNLTVIYGDNGSGKSGFSRILASACFSRSKQKIIKNVYVENASDDGAEAEFVIKMNTDADETVSFREGDENIDLRRVSFFDSSVARIHVTQDNELGFQPAGFDVFDEMARVIQAMTEKLESEIKNKTRTNTYTGMFVDPGPVAEKIANLSPDTNEDEIQRMAIFGDAEKRELEKIEQERNELLENSPAGVLRSLAEAKDGIVKVQRRLEAATEALNNEACDSARSLIAEHNKAFAKAFKAGAEAVFHPELNKTGGGEWLAFVEASQALGRAEDVNYPSDGAPCLLCHRPLDAPSVTLIQKMWGFLGSGDRRALLDVDDRVNNLISSLEQVAVDLLPAESKIRGDLFKTNLEIISGVDEISAALGVRRNAMINSLKTADTEKMPLGNMDLRLDILANEITRLEDREQGIKAKEFEKLLAEIEAKRNHLCQRQMLNKKINGVTDFITDLRWIKKAQEMKSFLNTRLVTEERKRLFQSVIEGDYRARLERECEKLGFLRPFEFKARGKAGKTLRGLKVREHNPGSIFSEGEQRILALADFLTEVNLNPASAAIILDDPVTSLDHKNRRKIVERLVEESLVRQVIIFTHDLVFLHSLTEECKKSDVSTVCHWINVMGGVPGYVSTNDSPDGSSDYRNASKAKEHLARAREIKGRDRVLLVHAGANALRRTIEEVVIHNLFKGVVQRWEEHVRVGSLKNVIWSTDLVGQLVNLYGEVSRLIGAHSNSDTFAAIPPDPDELDRLINQVEAIISQVGKKPSSR